MYNNEAMQQQFIEAMEPLQSEAINSTYIVHYCN